MTFVLLCFKTILAKPLIKVLFMFVVSAIITPPDILSQCLMAGPLVILYGVGIVLAYFFSTKERDEDDSPPEHGEV